MNKEFQQKLHYSLLQTAHEVQKIPTPTISDIESTYDEFVRAVTDHDMARQSKTVKALIAGLVRWEVENV